MFSKLLFGFIQLRKLNDAFRLILERPSSNFQFLSAVTLILVRYSHFSEKVKRQYKEIQKRLDLLIYMNFYSFLNSNFLITLFGNQVVINYGIFFQILNFFPYFHHSSTLMYSYFVCIGISFYFS